MAMHLPIHDLRPEHLYRLFIDGRFYVKEHGWEGYARRQAGCVEGMSLAYCHMLRNFELKDGLTLEYIQQLHDICTSRFKEDVRKNRYPGQIRDYSLSFLLRSRTSSLRGIEDLDAQGLEGHEFFIKVENKKSFFDSPYDAYLYMRSQKGVRYTVGTGPICDEYKQALIDKKPEELYWKARAVVRQNVEARCRQLIDQYNQKSAHCSGDDLVRCHIDLIKTLERTHPFVDCNNRVLINIVLNHLLMRSGELPVIYEDPNIFDGLTTEELVAEVKYGQSLVQQLIDDPDSEVFGHCTKCEYPWNTHRICELLHEWIQMLHP